MNSYIDDLIINGLGDVMSSCADPEIMSDEHYQEMHKKAECIYNKMHVAGLFTKEQMKMVEEYLEYMTAANARACDITFLVGTRNAILFMNELGTFRDLNDVLPINK